MRSLLWVVAFSVLATPSTAELVNKPYRLSPEENKAVRHTFEEILRDPSSARYSKIRASVSQFGIIRVCGFVNAKNGYGGYTGNDPFYGIISNTSPKKFTIMLVGAAVPGYKVLKECASYGISLEDDGT